MSVKKNIFAVALIAASVAMVGCSSKGSKSSYSARKSTNNDYDYAATTQGVGQSNGFAGNEYSEDSNYGYQNNAQNRTYRFPHDSYNLSDSDLEAVNSHANYLSSNPNVRVRIEGHTDETGSREYNVALGERRAKAVSQVLLSSGVSESQIDMVSYGQEKPESFGHEESAYQLNRRAEIMYLD